MTNPDDYDMNRLSEALAIPDPPTIPGSAPRCDACLDRVYAKPGCHDCADLLRELAADVELAEMVADAKWINVFDDGSEDARNMQDFAGRVHLLIRGIIRAPIPEAASRAVYILRRETGSPRYTRLVFEEAMEQVGLQLMEGVPLELLPEALERVQAAITAYRVVRPLGEPDRVQFVKREDAA